MQEKPIPDGIKQKVEKIIKKFNKEHLKNKNCRYSARYRGKYLYLDRDETGRPDQICHLTYTGKMNKWDFAIFRWSREKYDPDEWFFPGVEHVDGTVEGAMKAGLEAYPVNKGSEFLNLLGAMVKMLGGKRNFPE